MKVGNYVQICDDIVVVEYIENIHCYVLSTDVKLDAAKWHDKKNYLTWTAEFFWPAWIYPFNIPKFLGFEDPKKVLYVAKNDTDGSWYKQIGTVKYDIQLDSDFDSTGKYYLVPIRVKESPKLLRYADPVKPGSQVTDRFINSHFSGKLFSGKLVRCFSSTWNTPTYLKEVPEDQTVECVIYISHADLEWWLPSNLLCIKDTKSPLM